MKLVYVSSSTIPSEKANAVHVMRMCDALQQRGINTTLLCKRGNRDRSVWDEYQTSTRFKLLRLPFGSKRFQLVAYSLVSALYAAFMHRLGATVYARDILSCYILSFLGTPYSIEIHSLNRASAIYGILRRTLAHRKCQNIVVINDELKADLESWLDINSGRIKVLPDAAAPNPFARQKDVVRGSVSYTGSLYPGKGIDTILCIARKLPELTVNIAGGPERVWNEMYKRDAPPNVTYLGWQDQRTIQELQAGSEVLLLPNHPDVLTNNGRDNIGRYTSPLKLFEYMASGRPMIVSDLKTFRSIVSKDNAVLVDWSDCDRWVAELLDLIEDEDRQNRLADNALQRFSAKYSWARRARLIHEMLLT